MSESSGPVLLDTHYWVWQEFGHQHQFPLRTMAAIESAAASQTLFVSVISVWEIGMLQAKGRLDLYMPCDEWVKKALARSDTRSPYPGDRFA